MEKTLKASKEDPSSVEKDEEGNFMRADSIFE
jgi:hypothetical protein